MAFAHPIGGVRPVRSSRRRGYFVPVLLLTPAMLWLTVFFVVPTISLASQSLQTGDIDNGYTLTWNFQTYADALARYWSHFLRSFGYAATATVGTLLLGYPLAWFIAHRSGKYKNALLVLVVAPFFTNFLIRTLAWQIILTDTGPVTGFFRATGLTSVLQAVGLTNNDTLLFSPFAVVSGLVYNFLPFMVLPLYASLERLDTRLLDAAGDLYANGWHTFWRVIWPLSLPGVVSGTLLTFIPAAGDYINSKLLGNTQTVMIGQVIDAQFLRVLDYPTAAALSFILMITIIILVGVYVRIAGTEELV
ncbi:MAG: ABC transporter permease [Actinobacteria bacterium HGW-Actinobacteria-5]|jgi:spermidine/putrescine transport system permease protein|nr:MAG: ABC transporter permease [Actinobacteria bacterium HGW-Actinobacteria-5]